jgi:hypothetical protein
MGRNDRDTSVGDSHRSVSSCRETRAARGVTVDGAHPVQSMIDMLRRLAWFLALVGCGDNSHVTPDAAAVDAAPPDGPPDPFTGMFENPSDFPHTNCTPGSLAGFSYAGNYHDIDMRTSFDTKLHTFVATYVDELETHPLATPDDLFVRATFMTGSSWGLFAFDACGADADGTLHGSLVSCSDFHPDQFCKPKPIVVSPLHRIAGEGEGLHLTKLGEFRGPHWPRNRGTNVRVDGDVAYLSTLEDGLRIVSIANPQAPVELAHLVVAGDYVNDLKVFHVGGRTYVVTASSNGRVIDVTDPALPHLVAELAVSPHTVFVEGLRAYFATAYNGEIPVFDLSTPTSPPQIGGYTNSGFAAYHDLYVSGGMVYASDSSGTGLAVIDLHDPANPTLIGSEQDPGARYWHSPWLTTIAGKPIALDGDEGGGSGLRVLDADPVSATFLHQLAEWHLRDAVSIHNVMAIGNRAYAAHYLDGVRVLDLTDPTAPAMIGYYNTWIEGTEIAGPWVGTFGIDLDPARKRIYVADSIRGLVILQGDATVFP